MLVYIIDGSQSRRILDTMAGRKLAYIQHYRVLNIVNLEYFILFCYNVYGLKLYFYNIILQQYYILGPPLQPYEHLWGHRLGGRWPTVWLYLKIVLWQDVQVP